MKMYISKISFYSMNDENRNRMDKFYNILIKYSFDIVTLNLSKKMTTK